MEVVSSNTLAPNGGVWTFISATVGASYASSLREDFETAEKPAKSLSFFQSPRLYACLCARVFEHWLSLELPSARKSSVKHVHIVSPLAIPDGNNYEDNIGAFIDASIGSRRQTVSSSQIEESMPQSVTQGSQKHKSHSRSAPLEIQPVETPAGCRLDPTIDALMLLIDTICNEESTLRLQGLLQHKEIVRVLNDRDSYVRNAVYVVDTTSLMTSAW
jgi:hypothetical protein